MLYYVCRMLPTRCGNYDGEVFVIMINVSSELGALSRSSSSPTENNIDFCR